MVDCIGNLRTIYEEVFDVNVNRETIEDISAHDSRGHAPLHTPVADDSEEHREQEKLFPARARLLLIVDENWW